MQTQKMKQWEHTFWNNLKRFCGLVMTTSPLSISNQPSTTETCGSWGEARASFHLSREVLHFQPHGDFARRAWRVWWGRPKQRGWRWQGKMTGWATGVLLSHVGMFQHLGIPCMHLSGCSLGELLTVELLSQPTQNLWHKRCNILGLLLWNTGRIQEFN